MLIAPRSMWRRKVGGASPYLLISQKRICARRSWIRLSNSLESSTSWYVGGPTFTVESCKISQSAGSTQKVNNASSQYLQDKIENITEQQLDKTFRTNIYSMFFMAKAALNYMKEGCNIINTTSVTCYKGHPALIDYSATKGVLLALFSSCNYIVATWQLIQIYFLLMKAITTFTYSLASNLVSRGIRVNAVAPGPIWYFQSIFDIALHCKERFWLNKQTNRTPLIPASFPPEKTEAHGQVCGHILSSCVWDLVTAIKINQWSQSFFPLYFILGGSYGSCRPARGMCPMLCVSGLWSLLFLHYGPSATSKWGHHCPWLKPKDSSASEH